MRFVDLAPDDSRLTTDALPVLMELRPDLTAETFTEVYTVERRAREAGCRAIDLDSGVSRREAHRFYFRERMSITSMHFSRILTRPA